jgi:hypothetical protein
MRKIPTIFLRDPEDMRYVTKDPNPECDWVFAGEGVATRQYDGTCVYHDVDGGWWARREVKPGKEAPDNFRRIETDETTGKTVGWEPIPQSPFGKYHAEAVEISEKLTEKSQWLEGTYELIGPKVNGNPEKVNVHTLIKHEFAPVTDFLDEGRTWERIAEAMAFCRTDGIEGIVFHHPDGRMAKIKAKDFPA